jgi:RHS repeat-associated protein
LGRREELILPNQKELRYSYTSAGLQQTLLESVQRGGDYFSYNYNSRGDLTEGEKFRYARDSFGRVSRVENSAAQHYELLEVPIDLPYTGTVLSKASRQKSDLSNLSGANVFSFPLPKFGRLNKVSMEFQTSNLANPLIVVNGEELLYTVSESTGTLELQLQSASAASEAALVFQEETVPELLSLKVDISGYQDANGQPIWGNMLYMYDALGRRVQRELDSESGCFHRQYTYDGLQMVYDGSASYIYGLELNHVLAKIDNLGGVTSVLSDERGTVVGLADSSGNVTQKMVYSAWGQPGYMTSSGNLAKGSVFEFGYTGMFVEPYTGMLHTHFRDYDWRTHRWDREDPAGYVDGLNLYGAYFDVNGVDATGLDTSLPDLDGVGVGNDYIKSLLQDRFNKAKHAGRYDAFWLMNFGHPNFDQYGQSFVDNFDELMKHGVSPEYAWKFSHAQYRSGTFDETMSRIPDTEQYKIASEKRKTEAFIKDTLYILNSRKNMSELSGKIELHGFYTNQFGDQVPIKNKRVYDQMWKDYQKRNGLLPNQNDLLDNIVTSTSIIGGGIALFTSGPLGWAFTGIAFVADGYSVYRSYETGDITVFSAANGMAPDVYGLLNLLPTKLRSIEYATYFWTVSNGVHSWK